MSENIFLNQVKNKFSLKSLLFSLDDINKQSKDGWCILFESIASKDIDGLKKILNLNANLNIRDVKGRNALYWAIYYKNYEAIKVLIDRNIDVFVTPTLSAIHYAVSQDDVKSIKCLKNCGLNLNYLDEINATALIYAIMYDKIHSIDYLLKNDADINQRDVLGNSAYSLAKDLNKSSVLKKFNLNIK